MFLTSDFCFSIAVFQSATPEGFSAGSRHPAYTISGLAEPGVARLLVSINAFMVVMGFVMRWEV